MHSPIVSSTSYLTVSTAITGRMSEEDRVDLMRFLFMGPTRSVGERGQGDLGAINDWFEEDSEVSVPELVADLDDSFLGPGTVEQGKEATGVEETVALVQGEDSTDQEPELGLSEGAGEFEDEGDENGVRDEGGCAVPPARGAPSLSAKSLTLYRQLGEGGFGRVYAASLKGSTKVHALKIIPKTEENKDQAPREQDLLRRLIGCPFFSQLEASWQSNLNYYLVMPVYPGNLRDEIEKAYRFSIDVAHFYIKQILAGVHYLHSSDILHRDLKLENILLTQDGHVVICDLGLATIVLPDGRARRPFEEDPCQGLPNFYVENQSYCFGTPQSTAPEVVLGHPYGLPSDMWSLGVIIYEIITGQPPWRGEYESTAELYDAIIATDPDFVPTEWLDDAGLCLIAHRLLRKDPSRRPCTTELLFSHVFLEFGGWDSVQDFSQPGPLIPSPLSRGRVLKEFWPGYESEREQVTATESSFTFTGPGILKEIEDQQFSPPTSRYVRTLRRTKGRIVARIRPFLARINTSDVAPVITQTDSVPRISSATSYGSIDIPEVECLVESTLGDQEGSLKTDDGALRDLFPSLESLYLDESIRPLPSSVLYEHIPLVFPPPLSEVSSRLPSSEATSVYSSDNFFSSTESLANIAASPSTTPLSGLRGFGRAHCKNKQSQYAGGGTLVDWVRGLWRRSLSGWVS